MAYHVTQDGNLKVLGNVTVSSLTVSNGITAPGTQSFTGTASFTTGSAVYFTATTLTLTASSTSSANVSACTLNTRAGKITTTALTTLANTAFSLVITNSVISAADQIFWSITNGTNTSVQGPLLGSKLQSAGAVTLVVNTISAAINGTLIFDFAVFK